MCLLKTQNFLRFLLLSRDSLLFAAAVRPKHMSADIMS